MMDPREQACLGVAVPVSIGLPGGARVAAIARDITLGGMLLEPRERVDEPAFDVFIGFPATPKGTTVRLRANVTHREKGVLGICFEGLKGRRHPIIEYICAGRRQTDAARQSGGRADDGAARRSLRSSTAPSSTGIKEAGA